MGGIGRTLLRLRGAQAFLAGAAILAGAGAGAPAVAQDAAPDTAEEVAFAQPRLPGGRLGGGNVVLPEPLSPAEVALARRIFAYQAEGKLAEAAADTARLGNTVLSGTFLADRFLRHPDGVGPDALVRWLRQHGNQPDAPALHALLVGLLPRGAVPPVPAPVVLIAPPAPPAEEADPADRALRRSFLLDRTVRERARAGRDDLALLQIARTKGLDPLYGAQLRAEVARTLFTQGRDADALRLAEAAHRGAGGRIGLAPYVAGLAAWRLGRTDLARPLFEAASRAQYAAASLRAGAAFWAARSHLRLRDPAGYSPWMQRAARQPLTFYGLLARRALGEGTLAEATRPAPDILGQADVDAVDATAAGRRAFALLQVEQAPRAEAELRSLWGDARAQPALARSVMLVARRAGMDELAEQFAALSADGDRPSGGPPGAMPRLLPTGGFRVDPALVYALARLESNFDNDAVSPAGARGLLQIRPKTARSMTGDGGGRDLAPGALHDPGTNLALGQRYLLHLAALDAVGGDLIRLLASYNAGPTGFGRWADTVHHDGDPLMFIESIPNDETRVYVPRALSWTWLYAARLKLPAASLDELAAGAWPRFRGQAAAVPASARARLH